MFNSILIIFITSLVIYFFGKRFAVASSEIGDYYNVSHSVKGATLDAIAGSFPELMIALFAVLFFDKFDVGVGVIAGSVFFNTLIIPSIAVLVAPVVFRVSREVMARDALFYALSIIAFLTAILYSSSWGLAIAVIFLGLYVWYVDMIITQTKAYRLNHKRMLGEKISVTGKIVSVCVYIVIMGIAAYFLVNEAIILANTLNIPVILIGFSVVAMATSIPDMIIAIVNARKGRTDDVMSNVFGSNIFNILVGIGVPLLLASVFMGESIEIAPSGIEIILGLLVSTILVNYLIIDDYTITKKNALFMIAMYITFIIFLFSQVILM